MRVPKAKEPSWAVQAQTTHFGELSGFGRYRVYAVARWEGTAETGAAFVGGVWDNLQNRGLGAFSFPLGPRTPPPVPAPAAATPGVRSDTIQNGMPVIDGEYHVFDFGVFDFPHSEVSVWVGTTTGDLYVDRFVFVKEPL